MSTIKAAIFDEVRKLGADLAVASYSGGNDEGGVDGVQLFRRFEGEQVEVANDGVNEYDHPLWQHFDDLLEEEFGSWAGEFSAYGEIRADVTANTLTRTGGIQSGYTDDSETY